MCVVSLGAGDASSSSLLDFLESELRVGALGSSSVFLGCPLFSFHFRNSEGLQVPWLGLTPRSLLSAAFLL